MVGVHRAGTQPRWKLPGLAAGSGMGPGGGGEREGLVGVTGPRARAGSMAPDS